MDTIDCRIIQTEVGRIVLGAKGDALVLCAWEPALAIRKYSILKSHKLQFVNSSILLDKAIGEIQEYMSGSRKLFDCELSYEGTCFQRQVLDALSMIPYGTVMSYGDLAKSIGRPGAVRAVAHAVAMNPLSLFLPCHRVVPASGRVGNYAGGSDAKRELLRIEGICNL